jgi:hypothetical protein
MKEMIANYITAFEALITGKTLDDAYLLLSDLGYKEDRIILVGHKGLTTLERVCREPDWAKEKAEEIIIRFRGGPNPAHCVKKVFTASVRSFVVDRLLKYIEINGLDAALDSIRTIFGINVIKSTQVEGETACSSC